MILYDGIYEWDGTSMEGKQPICWWPGSYRMRIVDLSSDNPKVIYLKSYAVILKNRGKGTSLKNYIHNFAQVISEEFDLDIEKTLWAEIIANNSTNNTVTQHGSNCNIIIANIRSTSHLSDKRLFSSVWRDARENELKFLQPWIADLAFGLS
ncbi:MAG: hypothetical protein HQK64_11140 [Desulfamplus sp.]|nr:hypothetical protein [Desulfamplus sp.]MBF0389437.1 hypothetical protein [Desulfamplus sp.]